MFIQIDFNDALPIYDQIVRQIKFAVAGDVLCEGELIPSVRELARELTINPNTVARAYRQLQDEGILGTVRGTGLAVAGGAGRGSTARTMAHWSAKARLTNAPACDACTPRSLAQTGRSPRPRRPSCQITRSPASSRQRLA